VTGVTADKNREVVGATDEHPYVYLDYAASAPLRASALAAIEAYRAQPFAVANPQSLHSWGRAASRALEEARSSVARSLGGGFRPGDVSFTGGGTEANNLCLFGLAEGARAKDARRTTVLVSAIEHDSVLDVAPALKQEGFTVELLPVTREGQLDLAALAAALGPDVALVSCMYANNETGVLQPIGEVAQLAHAAGALLHVDAVQALGHVPVEVSQVDAVSCAGHKLGAPVSAAACAVRARTPFVPRLLGGGQEGKRRPGTQDVANARALAAVLEECVGSVTTTRSLVWARANALYQQVCAGGAVLPTVPAALDPAAGERFLPGMVSVVVPGLESESLILALDAAGFAVSAGSACSSGSLDPSHVLLAMGLSRDVAFGSLRISFDERVAPEDLTRCGKALLGAIERLKR
jgi:cysteine desulfurase